MSDDAPAEVGAVLTPDALHHLFVTLGKARAVEVAPVCWPWAQAFASASEWADGLAPAAEDDKRMGNERFGAGDMVAAIKCYTAAIERVAQWNAWRNHPPQELVNLELACLSNRAACCLRLRDFAQAVDDTAAAVFDGRFQSARNELRGVAIKAALRLLEAVEGAERARPVDVAVVSERFGSFDMAKRAAVMEAEHYARTQASASLHLQITERAKLLGVLAREEDVLPLLMAVAHGQLDRPSVLTSMLARGASVNWYDSNGNRPIYLAAEVSQTQGDAALRLLLEHGAWAGGRCRDNGRTPLMAASHKDLPSTVQLLLSARAPINATDHEGFTALHSALANESASDKVVHALLDAGADVNAVNRHGMAPLMYVAKCGPASRLRTLVERGASLSLRDRAFGFDALTYAHEVKGTDAEWEGTLYLREVMRASRGPAGQALAMDERAARYKEQHQRLLPAWKVAKRLAEDDGMDPRTPEARVVQTSVIATELLRWRALSTVRDPDELSNEEPLNVAALEAPPIFVGGTEPSTPWGFEQHDRHVAELARVGNPLFAALEWLDSWVPPVLCRAYDSESAVPEADRAELLMIATFVDKACRVKSNEYESKPRFAPSANWSGKVSSPMGHSIVYMEYVNPLQCEFGFGVPSPEVLREIAAHSPIVELGAGSGYWASQLTREGADVVAFDRHPPKTLADGLANFFFHRQFFPVMKGTPEVLQNASRVSRDRALLLVWPFQAELHEAERFVDDDRVEPWDAEALTKFQGDVILHVGHLEPKGDRLVNTSRRFVRLLRERFDLQLRLTATVGACANGPEELEALTVWRRKREPLGREELTLHGLALDGKSST